jgi:hypothetical protein
MIQHINDNDIRVSYTTSKAQVHKADSREAMMKFIIDERPMVVHQFWIDTASPGESKPDVYNMLYSKVQPAPDDYMPSDI